jgi:hypothetical protein
VEVVKHLQVGLNYDLGLTNNYGSTSESTESISGKNRGWSITAAILF